MGIMFYMKKIGFKMEICTTLKITKVKLLNLVRL